MLLTEWRTLLQPQEVDLKVDSVDQVIVVVPEEIVDHLVDVDEDAAEVEVRFKQSRIYNYSFFNDEIRLNSFAVSTEVSSSDDLKTVY